MANLGAMRERLTLQREDRVADDAGGNAASWTTLRNIWADVRESGGNSIVGANLLALGISHTIRTRWCLELGTHDGNRYRLLRASGQPLHIQSAYNPDQKRLYLVINATSSELRPA